MPCSTCSPLNPGDLLLLDQSAPFAVLDSLASELAAAGAGLVRVAAPGRSADALRALLDRGARPAGHRHRLSLEGHPERSDLRRALLWSAR